MKIQTNFLNLKSFFFATLFFAFAFSNVFAASSAENDKLVRSLVAGKLSAKLKTVLAQPNVSVKLANVEQRAITKNTIELKGDAVCLVKTASNNELPIRFEAKVNVAQKTVSSVNYDFVEPSISTAAPEYAPTSNEEFLMKELMKQISRDYRTENIVVALDGVEANQISLGEKQFSGVGEVRIGDMTWNKIKFDVTVDENGRAKKVVYDVKK